MKLKRHFYLMISCPGDVEKERKLLKECVDNINSERIDDIWVELQYWVTDTSSDAGTLAQDSINEQIVKESDGLIAIFNARLGTPVHEYKCGTEEEIALMLGANKHVSLLFNTKPQIDLSNSTSIDQITRLQEFKKEQSQKAFYREFSDEESFMALARREVLLWIRNITNSVQPMNAQDEASGTDHNKQQTNREEQGGHKKKDNKDVAGDPSVTVAEIDTNAGVLDCVNYIIDAEQQLRKEINNFASLSSELNAKTNIFADKFSVYNKQKNNSASLLALCKLFSNEIDTNATESHKVLLRIEIKWNEIYQYLKIINGNKLNYQDKIIIKDSVETLRESFVQTLPKLDELIDTFASTPNIQKDLKKSISGLSNVYKQFKSFTNVAITNCEEIESLLMTDNAIDLE